jgi:hypothetical protein
MFGSVPLRTYLPDGDIDISVFATMEGGSSESGDEPVRDLRDSWALQLVHTLERERGKAEAPFRIRDCQVIQAEVRCSLLSARYTAHAQEA